MQTFMGDCLLIGKFRNGKEEADSWAAVVTAFEGSEVGPRLMQK